jgi:hypothetical protein
LELRASVGYKKGISEPFIAVRLSFLIFIKH